MIREVTASDIPVNCAEYMVPVVWAGIFEGGELVGYGCLSSLHGKCWAHDLRHWGTDKTALVRLIRFLRKAARARGETEYWTDSADPAVIRLHERLGARVVSTILKGAI